MNERGEIRGRIVLGSGRSGTTWVQDCLAVANHLRPIFEPLHPAECKLAEQYAYRMVLPGSQSSELEDYFIDLSLGRINSLWIDYRGLSSILFPNPSTLRTPSAIRSYIWHWRKHLRDRIALQRGRRHPETLIKCIRANLMAGWFAQNVGFRVVLLVRHPCASIESQHRNSSAWNPEPVSKRYRSDDQLHQATQGRYLGLLNSPLSSLQALTLNWVIENQEPVSQAKTLGYKAVYYEQLRNEPSSSWPDICEALDLETVPNSEQLHAPSQQTYDKTFKNRAKSQHARWQQALKPDQLREIQAILDATECELYNVTNPWPLHLARLHC